MNNAMSLHIGLNKINSNVYGTDGKLSGCHNDARAMQSIASSLGYKTQILLDESATVGSVVKSISDAAKILVSGDIFMISYAGHGSQVKDITSDEDDGQDETWVLYDRMFIDDELYTLWSQFKAGVRIVVVSDSCHSGTVVRALYESRLIPGDGGCTGPYRLLDPAIAQKVFDDMTSCYEPIKYGMRGDQARNVSASIILLSGCQDNQLSGDGVANGLFTSKLIEVWGNGAFSGGYIDFISAIKKKMPFSQTPNLYKTGSQASAFEAQKPFSTATPRFIPEGGSDGREKLDFVLHMNREFVESLSEKDLVDYLRTDGADVLSSSYKIWKETIAQFSAVSASRGSWEVGCEAGSKGDWKCGGSIKGTF